MVFNSGFKGLSSNKQYSSQLCLFHATPYGNTFVSQQHIKVINLADRAAWYSFVIKELVFRHCTPLCLNRGSVW